MNDSQRRVTVLYAVGDDAERNEIVHLLDLDLLAPQFLADAPQALDTAVDLHHRHRRFAQLRDRGVDVARFLSDRNPALIRQVAERPHVVQAIGKLHQDDADVIHHRQQHLAEVLGLALLARRERNRPDLGHALDDVGDLGAEELSDSLGCRERVLDHVVEEARRHRDDVELHIRQ